MAGDRHVGQLEDIHEQDIRGIRISVSSVQRTQVAAFPSAPRVGLCSWVSDYHLFFFHSKGRTKCSRAVSPRLPST